MADTTEGSASFNPPTDNVESALSEQLGARLPELSVDISDEELAKNITQAIGDSMPLHNEIKSIQDGNEKYYLGDQLNGKGFSTRNEVRVVENRQFMSPETLIPIMTTEVPQPIVFTDKKNAEFGRSLEKVLMGMYQDLDTAISVATAVRHWMLYRLGVLKLVVDEDGMWDVVAVRPQRLVVGTIGVRECDVPFIAELVDTTVGEMVKRFPEKKTDILSYYTGLLQGGLEPDENTPTYYWEFHTNEFVAMKLGTSIILEKASNPLFDFDNKKANFVTKPFKPYFFINRIFSLGKTVYDDTSMAEQSKSLQDGINEAHEGIMADLSDRGAVIGSGEAISKEELKKFRGAKGEKIWIERGRPSDAITRLQPKVVTAAALAYQQRLADRSDDIWGTHGTSRGERGASETARGRIILKQGDTGRASPVSRVLDSCMRRLFQAQVQVIKLLWDEPKDIPYLDQAGMAELIKFGAENVPDDAKLQVKEGSALPRDHETEREEALELAKAGKISDEDLFEKLGYDHPQDAAKRVYLYKQVELGKLPPDVIFPGITQEIQRAMAESQEAGQSVANVDGAGGVAPTVEQPSPVDALRSEVDQQVAMQNDQGPASQSEVRPTI